MLEYLDNIQIFECKNKSLSFINKSVYFICNKQFLGFIIFSLCKH